MARKKAGKKLAPKKRLPKLETAFTCPFCNNSESVVCTFDKRLKIGEAICRKCKESYCTKINFLTEAIDIYSEWLDACEGVNTNEAAEFVPDTRIEEKKTETVSKHGRGWVISDSEDE